MVNSPLSNTALVVVYTLNEHESLERLVKLILQQPAPLHVLLIDDNSPDGAGQLSDQLARHDSRIHVFHRSRKLGLGSAYRLGCEYMLRSGYGWMVTMNADFSHNPRYIPQLLAMAQTNDLAIGSRYTPEGGSIGSNRIHSALSRNTNRVIRKLLRLSPTDCTSRFRCYSDYVLQQIHPKTVPGDRYSFLLETLVRCSKREFLVGEMPYIHDDRRLAPTRSLHSDSRSALAVFRLWFNRWHIGRWSLARPEHSDDVIL
ncbi:MAG: glycosyltransferase [Anaerolineae bacterium]